MPGLRREYVFDEDGWDRPTLLAATRDALALVAPAVTRVETDLPWSSKGRWPEEVERAARRLTTRFGGPGEQEVEYLRVAVDQVPDGEARNDFATFVPYAFEALLWADDGELARLHDEAASLAVWLTDEQREAFERTWGQGRLMDEHTVRERYPSLLRRLTRRLRREPPDRL